VLATAFSLFGQSVEGPEFEVASLKKVNGIPNPIQDLTGGPGTSTPARVTMRSGVRQLLQAAFDRTWSEFANTEKVPNDWYEFAATMRESVTKDEYRAMLRNLLIERFHLRYHRENRNIKRYEIRIAPGGPKMKDTTNGPDPAPGELRPSVAGGYVVFPAGVNSPFYGNGARFSVQRVHTTLEEFARQIQAEWLHSPVVDQTGLTGRYDFILHFTATPNAEGDATEPDLAAAMRQQLGLILREVTGPAAVVVIDSMDREATPN
jgi:uncharacterized protein (TIGR03435 family)